MNRFFPAVFLLFYTTVSAFAEDVKMIPAPEKTKSCSFEIFYCDELTNIDIQDKKFRYSWKTPPPGAGNLAGPESYAEQVAEFELTDDQVNIFKGWAEKQNVFELKGPDSKGDENAPVAAISICLSVGFGEKKMNLSWTGASRWNNAEQRSVLDSVVEGLNKICKEIVQENNKGTR